MLDSVRPPVPAGHPHAETVGARRHELIRAIDLGGDVCSGIDKTVALHEGQPARGRPQREQRTVFTRTFENRSHRSKQSEAIDREPTRPSEETPGDLPGVSGWSSLAGIATNPDR